VVQLTPLTKPVALFISDIFEVFNFVFNLQNKRIKVKGGRLIINDYEEKHFYEN